MSAAHNDMGGVRAPGDIDHGKHEAYTPVFTGARRKELEELFTR